MDNLKLTLVNYFPFLINGIKEFVYTPTKPTQLIIGSNGSGKSSLMRQLSYLPGESSDFAKGGMKIVETKDYKLISDFTKGGSGEHSFIHNGENLNPGKTLSVQKTLVEYHFGITKEIHSLLIGEKGSLFSDMTPSKRKEWLTKLSPSNFDFLIDLFQTSATELRDRTGAIKINAGKLNNLTNNETNDEEETIQSVRENVDNLKGSLKTLRAFREDLLNSLPNPSGYQKDTEKLLDELEKVSENIISCSKTDIRKYLSDIAMYGYHEVRTKISTEISHVTRRIQEINDNLLKLEGYLESLELTKDQENQEDRLKEIANILPKELIDLNNAEEIERSFKECRNLLLTNHDRVIYTDRFTKENFSRLIASKKELEANKANSLLTLDKLNSDKRKLTLAKQEACKNCGFYEKLEGVDFESLEKEIESLGSRISVAEKELEKIEEEIDEFSQWSEHVSHIKSLRNKFPELEFLVWREYLSGGYIKKPLGSLKQMLASCQENIALALEYHIKKREVENIIKASEITKSFSGLSKAEALGTMESLSSERSELFTKEKSLKKDLSMLDSLDSSTSESDSILNKLIDKVYSDLRKITTEVIEKDAVKLETAIGMQYQRLSELEGRKNLIIELTQSLEELREEARVFNIIVSKLSPNTGLIAKMLTSSINGVINNMNLIIESIWTSPLRIEECNIENGKLDYKFPLSVKDYPIKTKDISFGSQGQKDIIDFTFRAIAYDALKLENYPLFLDEFGSSFDEQHKFNTTELIKMFISKNNHPYIFYISHYYGQHGGLTNNETLVLDDSNVSVPVEYNKHVVIS